VSQPAYIPLSFGSTRHSQNTFNVFTTDASGARQNPITSGANESLPFSVLRSWDEKNVRIIGDTRRDGKRQLFSWMIDGSQQTRLLTSTANDYNASISPDGKKIAFASDRAGAGKTDIWLLNLDGGGLVNLTKTATPCVNEYPTWFPDGSAIAYNSNCGGNWEIFIADLSYAQDKGNDLQASLVNPTNISKNAASDRYPRISPSGQHIAFRSDRDGNGEIYVFRARTGQALRQFTNTTGADNDHSAPTWSPDGKQIVYDSNIEGDYEIYSRNEDGTGGERKLTDNNRDDRWPVWAQ
jgi:Tol biopolymer transport system component